MNKSPKKRGMLAFLSLLLLGAMMLTACPAVELPPPAAGTGSTSGGGTPAPHPNPDFLPGDAISGGGDSIEAGSLALTGRAPAESVTELTLADLKNMMRGSGFAEGATYRVTEAGSYSFSGTAGRNYDFKNAVLIIPGGVIFDGCEGTTVNGLTVISENAPALKLQNSAGMTLSGVEAVSAADAALSTDEVSEGLFVENCRLVGARASTLSASHATLLASYIEGGLSHAGECDLFIENCRLVGTEYALKLASDDSRIWYSTVKAEKSAESGIIATDCLNLLVALNSISGSPTSVSLTRVTNGVVLLNAAVGVKANGCHSITLAENNLWGSGDLVGNNYVLANQNTVTAPFVIGSDNENLSGDNLTDVDAREEYGVNYDLLPKVDKELFVGMERKETVRVSDTAAAVGADIYVRNESAVHGNRIILAPGAYTLNSGLNFNADHEDITLYGYGVYLEKVGYGTATIYVGAAKNLTFKGLQLDHTVNSTGQGVVINKYQKNGGNYIEMITGAGMLPDWTDSKYYDFTGLTAGTYGYRPGNPQPYADMGPDRTTMVYDAKTGITTLQYSQSQYNMIEVGDTLTCRGGHGANVIALSGSTNIRFEDITVFGGAGFAFREDKTFGGTEMLRVYDTTGPAPLIDEETYFHYLDLEERYGVSFVYADELGRYRGTTPKTSSVDATHSSGCEIGLSLVSCLFESMCDDGTNQHSTHGRFAGIKENDDGTLTITYKSNLSAIALGRGSVSGGVCADFRVGDRVFIYSSEGRLLCDTEALSGTSPAGSETNEYGGRDMLYTVKIAAGEFKTDALEGIDLSSASPYVKKICVDNMSRTSNGFYIDNTVVQNIRSRGLLIKGSNGTIKNCSIISVGMGGIAIRYELDWGESGISENLKLLNNYIENGGHYGNADKNTPISIYGLGARASDEYLLYSNIEISGNHIVDRNTSFALYINSARGVTVKNNHFGTRRGYTSAEDTMPAIRIDCAKDVEISGNTFPSAATTDGTRVSAMMNLHVYGDDVTAIADDIAASGSADDFKNNIPAARADGSVVYSGNWTVGYTGIRSTEYTPYNTAISAGWICHNGKIWGGNGGFWMDSGHGLAGQPAANAVICYTAPAAGRYLVRISGFSAPGGNGPANGYFAIATAADGILWPNTGDGDYATAANYYLLTPETTLFELQAEMGEMIVELEEGEQLLFVAKYKDGWSNFTIYPTVVAVKE